jgi:Protein of unknown function (DUF1553)/Protein of unknown function (DUF1549)
MVRLSAGLLALGLCGAAVAADPPAKTGEAPFAGSTTQAINHHIAEGWSKADIKKPADKAPDLEFLRRCYIDLIGRVAAPDEVLDFEQDKTPAKRAKLVNRLLNATEYTPKVNGQPVKGEDGKKNKVYNYAEEFANHWANQWTVTLLSRTTHRVYRDQLHAWLADEFSKDTPWNQVVKQLISATGSGNRNGAANFVAVHLGDPIPGDKRAELGNHDAVPITSRVTRLFLGIQTQCTQCHDHPFIKGLEQPDFWGVNAFFRQTTRSATPTGTTGNQNQMMKVEDKIELKDNDALNKEGRVFYDLRNGKLAATKAVFLKGYAQIEAEDASAKGTRLPVGKSRREMLADYVTAHDNFGRAYVNRVWGHLFGRGLQKDPSIDDFGSHNEIVHRELIDRLAGDFAKYNYNTKALLEWICTSDVYGLSHVATKEYADQKYDPYFARMPLKAMSPETLFDSLAYATQSEAVTGKDPARRRTLRDAWLGKLVRNFGDDEGNELTFNGTIVQALLMMNGKELNDEVKRKDTGVVAETMKKHAKKQGEAFFTAVTDDLFLTALNRHATKAELTVLKDILVKGGTLKTDKPTEPAKGPTPTLPKGPNPPKGKGPNPKDPPPSTGGPVAVGGSNLFDPSFYQDVFWALLNTNEFILNH